MVQPLLGNQRGGSTEWVLWLYRVRVEKIVGRKARRVRVEKIVGYKARKPAIYHCHVTADWMANDVRKRQ